jgi:hypothetical protein
MPNITKLKNIVLEALQTRGYSQTEAEQFITQITAHENIKIKGGTKKHEHYKGQEIDIFI